MRSTSEPQPEPIHFNADAEGQLNLLDFELPAVNEPPDPDDFESLDAFREAIAVWDAENPEPPTVSMVSMCEWAPCPEEWYWLEARNSLLKPSSRNEKPEFCPDLQCTDFNPQCTEQIESSSICNFSIPIFDAWCDRPNDKDEPPDTGVFARLPKPKPPSFPPMFVAAGDRSSIKKFVRSATLLSGRDPPGGDAM